MFLWIMQALSSPSQWPVSTRHVSLAASTRGCSVPIVRTAARPVTSRESLAALRTRRHRQKSALPDITHTRHLYILLYTFRIITALCDSNTVCRVCHCARAVIGQSLQFTAFCKGACKNARPRRFSAKLPRFFSQRAIARFLLLRGGRRRDGVLSRGGKYADQQMQREDRAPRFQRGQTRLRRKSALCLPSRSNVRNCLTSEDPVLVVQHRLDSASRRARSPFSGDAGKACAHLANGASVARGAASLAICAVSVASVISTGRSASCFGTGWRQLLRAFRYCGTRGDSPFECPALADCTLVATVSSVREMPPQRAFEPSRADLGLVMAFCITYSAVRVSTLTLRVRSHIANMG
jgi:hypothetical protein